MRFYAPVRSSAALFATVSFLAARPCGAQMVGQEFRVNTTTTYFQGHSRVATISDVEYVIVWRSPTATTNVLFGQRITVLGDPSGSQFLVNANTAGGQDQPDVASDAAGNFTVVWEQGLGIWGQRFNFVGAPIGGEFRVDTFTTSAGNPAIAYDSAGDFLVAWDSEDGDGRGIFARKFAGSGGPLTAAFQVNTFTTANQEYPAVGGAGTGFVVAWASYGQEDLSGVYAQRFSAAAAPLGIEFHVNTNTTAHDDDERIATNRFDGSFVIVFRGGNDGDSVAVAGQRYSAAGAPLGGEFQANTFTTGNQSYPVVAFDSPSTFIVSWTNVFPRQVRARRFSANGTALGGELAVSTGTDVDAIAARQSIGSHFVVVVEKTDGAGDGIWARVGCLVGDANGDGLVDVSDVFYLINYLFAGGTSPHGCADVNGIGGIDIADVFYLINYLFASGPPPV
jgi:hypothetical protein